MEKDKIATIGFVILLIFGSLALLGISDPSFCKSEGGCSQSIPFNVFSFLSFIGIIFLIYGFIKIKEK